MSSLSKTLKINWSLGWASLRWMFSPISVAKPLDVKAWAETPDPLPLAVRAVKTYYVQLKFGFIYFHIQVL